MQIANFIVKILTENNFYAHQWKERKISYKTAISKPYGVARTFEQY